MNVASTLALKMKYSQQSTQASSSESLANPTSLGATLCQYAIIAYEGALYLLHDNPRHVQYRDSLTRYRDGTVGAGRSQIASIGDTGPTSTSRKSSTQHQSTARTAKSHYRPKSPTAPQSSRGHCHVHSGEMNSTLDTVQRPEPSKAQMSEAWMRLRPISGSRTESTGLETSTLHDNVIDKSRRGIKWGPVQVIEPEFVHHRPKPKHCKARNGMVKSNIPSETKAGADRRQEIWGPVLSTEDENEEIWCSV